MGLEEITFCSDCPLPFFSNILEGIIALFLHHLSTIALAFPVILHLICRMVGTVRPLSLQEDISAIGNFQGVVDPYIITGVGTLT